MKIIKNDKGSILPLIALLMVILFGFTAMVVDAGSLYVDRRAMVTAADAAALAGARELSLGRSHSQAKNVAIEVAAANNAIITTNEIFIGSREITIPGTTIKETREIIEVKAKKNRELLFAKFIGHSNADVGAQAIATWGFVTEVKGGDILPLFLMDSAYNSGISVLHDGKLVIKDYDASANWGYIDIDANWPDRKKLISGEKKSNHHFEIDNNEISDVGNKQSVIDEVIKRIDTASGLESKTAKKQFLTGLVPIIDEAKFISLNPVNINSGKYEDNKLSLPIKCFAIYEIEDVAVNKNIGYSGSLDKPDYISNGIAESYSGYEKGTIIGSFTGSFLEIGEVINEGDQTNPNAGGARPATYFKLID